MAGTVTRAAIPNLTDQYLQPKAKRKKSSGKKRKKK
jgi:hypothetical protein